MVAGACVVPVLNIFPLLIICLCACRSPARSRLTPVLPTWQMEIKQHRGHVYPTDGCSLYAAKAALEVKP